MNLAISATTDTAQLKEEGIIQASKKDPKAFQPLYEKYFKRIFLFVLHRVDDKEIAGDITSQVFLKALLRIGQYQSMGLPFSAWLFRIALNECSDHFRKTKRSKVLYIEDLSFSQLFEEIFPDDQKEDLEKKLEKILQKLKPEELQIIELRYFEGMSFKMTAEILNITETNAKVKTYRTLDKMKKIFLEKI